MVFVFSLDFLRKTTVIRLKREKSVIGRTLQVRISCLRKYCVLFRRTILWPPMCIGRYYTISYDNVSSLLERFQRRKVKLVFFLPVLNRTVALQDG